MSATTSHAALAKALVVLACFAGFALNLFEQSAPDVTGEWDASYITPLGPQELTIYLQQEGPRISGHTTSEFGEFQVRGTINGNEVKFSWTEVDGGKNITVAVTGKVDGDTISGTAAIGERGSGTFKAQRTGSG